MNAGDRIRTCAGTKPQDLKSCPFDQLWHSRRACSRNFIIAPILNGRTNNEKMNNHLFKKISLRRELNSRPPLYESDALPTELLRHFISSSSSSFLETYLLTNKKHLQCPSNSISPLWNTQGQIISLSFSLLPVTILHGQ